MYIQVQNDQIPEHELLAEHQLYNIAASDYGAHSSLTKNGAEQLFKWVY